MRGYRNNLPYEEELMINLIMGFVGLGLFGYSGTFQPEYRRPEIFQGRIGSAISWAVMLGGLYLIYQGWIRPWL
jgi:hypothetical protein